MVWQDQTKFENFTEVCILKNKIKNKKAVRLIITCIIVLLSLIIGIFFLCRGCSKNPEESDTTTKFVIDDEAVEGGWVEADEEEIRENLNKSVEAGYINISMNTTPYFKDGTSEGNLMIVNEDINKYPQKVVITRNDTGEVIYESKGIPVGSKIEKAKLSVDLSAGIYECTAMFHNVDPDTGNSLGCAGAVITITVEN